VLHGEPIFGFGTTFTRVAMEDDESWSSLLNGILQYCMGIILGLYHLIIYGIYGIRAMFTWVELIFSVLDSVPVCVGDMQKTVWVFEPMDERQVLMSPPTLTRRQTF
jgi:hypothetical protein